jgi:hypothetical protein
MNEPAPEPTPPVPTAIPYKDRSAGLIVFGILTILMGCAVGLMVPLMIFGQVASGRTTGAPANIGLVLPVVVFYGSLAVALIWLGIGSVTARRWARALLLIFSWTWLIMGILMTAVMGFLLPKIMESAAAAAQNTNHAMPQSAIGIAVVAMLLVMGFLFVLLPALWTFFYQSRHVKATCEARDPVTRWTDACPLPVLGLCLWVLFALPMLLLMPLSGHVVLPFFGAFLTGLPGSLVCLVLAAIWGYAAWLLYRLDVCGWWLILVALLVYLASSLLTFAHHDVTEMYQLMGYPPAQIDQMQKMGIWSGNRLICLMCVSMVPFLAYLFFVKKYFGGKQL